MERGFCNTTKLCPRGVSVALRFLHPLTSSPRKQLMHRPTSCRKEARALKLTPAPASSSHPTGNTFCKNPVTSMKDPLRTGSQTSRRKGIFQTLFSFTFFLFLRWSFTVVTQTTVSLLSPRQFPTTSTSRVLAILPPQPPE